MGEPCRSTRNAPRILPPWMLDDGGLRFSCGRIHASHLTPHSSPQNPPGLFRRPDHSTRRAPSQRSRAWPSFKFNIDAPFTPRISHICDISTWPWTMTLLLLRKYSASTLRLCLTPWFQQGVQIWKLVSHLSESDRCETQLPIRSFVQIVVARTLFTIQHRNRKRLSRDTISRGKQCFGMCIRAPLQY